MLTFLPYESFVKSAESFDDLRLSQQIIDACHILEILTSDEILTRRNRPLVPIDISCGVWARHPAVNMWRDHEEWLKNYLACVIGEREYRGLSNSVRCPSYDCGNCPRPDWLGMEELHRSHRSNLIRKRPGHYMVLFPDTPSNLPIFWPTEHAQMAESADASDLKSDSETSEGSSPSLGTIITPGTWYENQPKEEF